MSKITLRLDTLAVESFEPQPGAGDVPSAWTEWDCGTYDCQPSANFWAYTCGHDITCNLYNCDS
jgi:hypothetical protein